MGWIQVTPNVTLSNVTPLNNLLLNSYFENGGRGGAQSSEITRDYPPFTKSLSNPVIGTYPFIQSCNHTALLNLVIMWT